MKASIADAIAKALVDLGVEVVTNVPGFGGTETFSSYRSQSMKNPPVSFNEEVAYSIAHGASIVGERSALLTKAHGIAKAGNAVLDSLYTELTAGFVTIIFEDKVGDHSDNIMEIEPILQGFYFPYELGKPATIYNDVVKCFHESERRKTPIALLVDAAKINKEISFQPHINAKSIFHYERDVYKHVVSPLLSEYQAKVFSSKKFYGDSSAVQKPDLIQVPDNLPQRYKDSAIKYQPFFEAFKEFRGEIVTGDTSVSSSYSMPPYNAIDIVSHIGGSIPLAIGAYAAGKRNVWALTGDFGFISAGHMGLVEIIQREIPIKVVIFYNKQAAATGGQLIQKRILRRMLAGYDNYIIHISDPSDPLELNQALTEASEADEFRIILADY